MSKRNDEIVTRYIDDGFSLQDVGKEFGITRERVRQILAHAGITERHQGIHNKLERKSTTQDAYARITEGLITVVEEAERIGIKTTSLYARFHRYQLPSLKKEGWDYVFFSRHLHPFFNRKYDTLWFYTSKGIFPKCGLITHLRKLDKLRREPDGFLIKLKKTGEVKTKNVIIGFQQRPNQNKS